MFSPNDSHRVASVRQELQVEKQKTNRVEAVMRERCATMEKELGNMQNKAQSNFQELQTMQMKVRAFFYFPVAMVPVSSCKTRNLKTLAT